jgi:hypothetical protein
MLKRVRSLAARVSAALEFIQRASIAQRREYYERLREIKRQR